ncbi:MAG TPA: hypothetical protein VLH86_06245 [Patescibacteria group bacterium]|nr:hypothetical protein [Patescibacteria group bacterium]
MGNKLGHLIYTYNNLDDAYIQQELSKKLYAQQFGGVQLVHAYDGKPEFGYKKYLEDELITIDNPGHFRGATALINTGLNYFMEHGDPEVQYVLVAASDSWLLNVGYLEKIIATMQSENRVLAASSWFSAYPQEMRGFSTDFFIIDITWNREAKLFPLGYDAFVKKFEDVLALNGEFPFMERAVQYYFQKYLMANYEDYSAKHHGNELMLRITSREPVDGDQRAYNREEIGLFTAPDPAPKQAALKALGIELGPHSKKLVEATDLSYYNLGRDWQGTYPVMATI